MAKKKENTPFAEYSQETQTQMKNIINYLKEKYKTISLEWFTALNMLADNIELFNQCKQQIKNDGICITINNIPNKHPLLKVQTDSQIQIMKILSQFGLTPYSSGKIKTFEDEDNSENFINALCNG